MTDKEYLSSLRTPNPNDPLRILLSSCLVGTLCGADGSSYGDHPIILKIANHPLVEFSTFCPEHFSFGTPREIPDIEGGNGADVLEGNAKVITESGRDITEGMMIAAHKMLEIAQEEDIELAILMDISAACGSKVIYKGHRSSDNPQYQKGMGVCAALLSRNGFKIISQRDYRSLDILFSKIDPEHEPDRNAVDHDETEWYRAYFKENPD